MLSNATDNARPISATDKELIQMAFDDRRKRIYTDFFLLRTMRLKKI
jgi:hypothetical protein